MKIKRGDIVYVSDNNKYQGNIQNRNRPFLIVSNDIGNSYSNICLRCTAYFKI